MVLVTIDPLIFLIFVQMSINVSFYACICFIILQILVVFTLSFLIFALHSFLPCFPTPFLFSFLSHFLLFMLFPFVNMYSIFPRRLQTHSTADRLQHDALLFYTLVPEKPSLPYSWAQVAICWLGFRQSRTKLLLCFDCFGLLRFLFSNIQHLTFTFNISSSSFPF